MTQQETILKGEIVSDRHTFHAEDTGYIVTRFQQEGEFDTIAIVGTMPDPQAGCPVELTGQWVEHQKFGKQFQFTSYLYAKPSTQEQAVAFLSTLKHVGGSLAQIVWDQFGPEVFDVLDQRPEALLSVPGIGPKKHPEIVESYQKTRGLRQLIEFLHGLGVGAAYAKRIWQRFESSAIGEIQKNPYILCEEVRGFGFKRADHVARGMGIEEKGYVRIKAGVLHVLKEAAQLHGHCWLESGQLEVKAAELLALPGVMIQSIDVARVVGGMKKELILEDGRVYLKRYWQAEHELADCIEMFSGKLPPDPELKEWLAGFEARQGWELAFEQRAAVKAASEYKLSVLTGGPGRGKTAVSKAIIEWWHHKGRKVVACAPTGKAAMRIKEVSGVEASTIHRLLGWTGHGFARNADDPIECDAILIDEGSMPNLVLYAALLRAIPAHAQILVVGDPNQLPCIGAGDVLRDMIASGLVPVTELVKVFRQSETSRIVQVSEDINEGQFPCLQRINRHSLEPHTDALWVSCNDASRIPLAIKWTLETFLPQQGIKPEDTQVLSPQHSGESGNRALNKLAQDIWNPMPVMRLGDWRLGDRVVHCKNDYDRDVFNGEIGVIEVIDPQEKELRIRYPSPELPEGKLVKYTLGEMSDVVHAYSLSIHKSQGSEFPVVVIPVTMQHYMMLRRNLLYTGVTRGKQLVVLVGQEKAIQQAVRTRSTDQRNTTLQLRLEERLGGGVRRQEVEQQMAIAV